MSKQNNRRGFTITELIIVIVVIAILAAVLIPTFASLIDKANMSADESAVRQMNTILAAEEAVDGKAANVAEVQAILTDNGISDFIPMETRNTFYWVGAENRVLLWTMEEMPEHVEGEEADIGKVTYPKELAKKYASVTVPSADWGKLGESYDVVIVAPEEDQTIEDAFLTAVQGVGIDDHSIVMLPKNTTLDLGGGQDLAKLAKYMESNAGVGKDVTIDLNGGSIISTDPYVYNDGANSWNYSLQVPAGATLELVNGTVDIVATNGAFEIAEGASLVLRELDIKASGYASIFPSSKASEVIIEDCNIECDSTWGLMTNGMTSEDIRLVIKDTTIKNNGDIGIMVNCTSHVHVENSEIIASYHAVVVRAGHFDAVNSTLKTLKTDVGIYKWDEFDHFSSMYRYWGTGNAVPSAVLVLGDHSEGTSSYKGDVEGELMNVKIESADATATPTVLLAARAQKNVAFIYDDASSVGTPVLYDYPHPMENGTVVVNGVAQTFSEFVLPDIVTWYPGTRYNVPTAVGTFGTYQFHPISDLDVVVDGVNILEDFKANMAAQGLELTEAQWATVRIAAGSTANVIKTVEYDRSAS